MWQMPYAEPLPQKIDKVEPLRSGKKTLTIDDLTFAQWLTAASSLILEELNGEPLSITTAGMLLASSHLAAMTRMETDPEKLKVLELEFIEGLRKGCLEYAVMYLGLTLEQANASVESEKAKAANQVH